MCMRFRNPLSYRVCPTDALEENEDSKALDFLALDTSSSADSWMVRERQQTSSVGDSFPAQEQNRHPALAVLCYAQL